MDIMGINPTLIFRRSILPIMVSARSAIPLCGGSVRDEKRLPYNGNGIIYRGRGSVRSFGREVLTWDQVKKEEIFLFEVARED